MEDRRFYAPPMRPILLIPAVQSCQTSANSYADYLPRLLLNDASVRVDLDHSHSRLQVPLSQ